MHQYNLKNIGNQKAFTLLETIIVVTLISILLTIAVPSFQTFIQNSRLEPAAFRVFEMLKKTRNNALTTGTRSFVCRTTNSQAGTCQSPGGTDWSSELMSYTLLTGAAETVPDGNFGNQQIQTVGGNGADLNQMRQAVREAGHSGLTVIANDTVDVIGFRPDGSLMNPAPIEIAICDDRGVDFGKYITVNAAGLVRLRDTGGGLTCTP